MCLMTVHRRTSSGDQTRWENVAELRQTPEGVELVSLFGERDTIPGVQVVRIDFSAGRTWLGEERDR